MAGRINLCRELADRLAGRGHQVTIASPVDITPHLGPAADGFVLLSATMDPVEMAASFAELRPDLALVDVELPLHFMAASSAGPRAALWTSMMSLRKRPGVPPLHTSIVPGVGWKGSPLGIEWAWLKFRVGKWLGYRRRQLQQRRTARVARLKAAAGRLGFPLDRQASLYDWLVPYTFHSVPVLSFNATELEFPNAVAANVRYVGPVLPRQVPVADGPLAELAARRERGDSQALLYIGFGAWHRADDGPFIRRLVAAVADRPEWDVVCGLGDRMEPAALGPIPGNFHVLRWAPQRTVLAIADVAVHHAGISSVNECVAAAVPMVLYPFDFLDQGGNAARVAFHGLGEIGDRETDSPEAICRRIDRVLADTGMREQVRRKQAQLTGYDDEDRAAVAVEELLGGAV